MMQAILQRRQCSLISRRALSVAGSSSVSLLQDKDSIIGIGGTTSSLLLQSLLPSVHASTSSCCRSSDRLIDGQFLLRRSYHTLPSSTPSSPSLSSCLTTSCGSVNKTNNNYNDTTMITSICLPATTSTTTMTIQKRNKVFVSRHNQTLNLSPQQITSYITQQLPHLNDNSSMMGGDPDFRITSTHVIMKECPFCTKPTLNKPDNFYKLYIASGHGAYFCHRCGAKGSWYDLKSELGGFHIVDNTSAAGGGGGGNDNNGYRNNRQYHQQQQLSTPQQQQQQQQQQQIQPLAMPHAKLNSLYSSQLFATTPNPQSNSNNNKDVLEYLLKTRGLTKSVLRKYGVGCAEYKFPSKQKAPNNKNNGGTTRMEYVSSMCVTFPWLMRQSEVETQEELRGARYVWRKDNDDTTTTITEEEEDNKSEEERQREEESKRRIEAAAAALAAEKKKQNHHSNKSRLEMTALERYYAKRTRRARSSTKKKVLAPSSSSGGAEEMEEQLDGTTNSLFTPPNQPLQQQQQQEPLTNEEIEVLHGPYITRRIKVRSIEQKSWQRLDPPGGGFGLFGWHTVPNDATEIIITEGEFDAMAVYQETGRHAVSLPNGCRSLPMEVLVLLEKFDTIYLWMDNDGPGREGAEMFARKLGVERCLLVQPSGKRGWKNGSDGVDSDNADDDEEYVHSSSSGMAGAGDYLNRPPPPKDANEALLMGWDINELLNEASELPHERILKFSDLRDQVIHEITNPDKYRGVPIPSLPGFTSLIKGFRRGEMTVLTGPTGSGKTTFLGQTSLDLAEQGVNVLWGSFEIKNTRLMHKLLQQYMKDILPVGLADREGSFEEKKRLYEELQMLADKFESLPMHFMKFHGGSDIDDVLDAMEYAAYVHDVEHIILDNMQFMISRDVKKMSSSFDKFDMQDIAIEKFRKFATDYNVHGKKYPFSCFIAISFYIGRH
jgi:hypothetical protein